MHCECCVSVTSYFDSKFLASSIAVSPRSGSPEPHLAPSASVPIPFRGKNVKTLPWLIPRWCLWGSNSSERREGEEERITHEQWGLFRFKMHCVCWQRVGPTLFDVLPLVRLWAFEGFTARCDSAANGFQMPPVWEPGSGARGETGKKHNQVWPIAIWDVLHGYPD